MAGVRPHLGKLEAWSPAGGSAPPGLDDINAQAWKADLPSERNGMVILGVPIGTEEFVATKTEERINKERELLEELPLLPDLQSSWALLLHSAVPRAIHFLRLLPPTVAKAYTIQHDDAIMRCLSKLLQLQSALHRESKAAKVASLPARLGGLGLRSAVRSSPAAYWAAAADTLHMIQVRNPAVAAAMVEDLQRGEGARSSSLREVVQAGRALDRAGMQDRPTWAELAAGARPPQDPTELGQTEPGEWSHGWQYFASLALETYFREQHLLPSLGLGFQAMLRSASGPGAAHWLAALPTGPEFKISEQVYK